MKPVSICYAGTFGLLSLILTSLLKLNVVVHEDGRAALCDFGLSYLKASILQVESPGHINASNNTAQQKIGFTATGFNGTLRYLSPEQLSCDNPRPTFAADIYAFACTCAEVCMVNALPRSSPF